MKRTWVEYRGYHFRDVDLEAPSEEQSKPVCLKKKTPKNSKEDGMTKASRSRRIVVRGKVKSWTGSGHVEKWW